jgi:hypothetical protein
VSERAAESLRISELAPKTKAKPASGWHRPAAEDIPILTIIVKDRLAYVSLRILLAHFMQALLSGICSNWLLFTLGVDRYFTQSKKPLIGGFLCRLPSRDSVLVYEGMQKPLKRALSIPLR